MKRTMMTVLLLILVLGAPLTAGAASLNAMFYKPLEKDLTIGEKTWSGYFDKMRVAGVETLYIQWTVYGGMDFRESLTPDGPFLELMYDLAGTYGITIRAGLYHDPEFFRMITVLPPEKLERYLEHLRKQSMEVAHYLSRDFGFHPAFGGWYLPEEIDDKHWRTNERHEQLANHLDSMVKSLEEVAPGTPVAVSTFFTGKMTPKGFADMWQKVYLKTTVELMVKDGVGASDLSVYDSGHYFTALDKTLKNKYPWGLVLELFEPDKLSREFSASPADISRVKDQVVAANRFSGPMKNAAFSLRYFLFDNSALYDEYMKVFSQ